MTHPHDRAYRFRKLTHWGRGYAENLTFGNGEDEALATRTALRAHRIGPLPGGVCIAVLTIDPGGRAVVLGSDGGLWTLHGTGFVRLTAIDALLTQAVQRLVLGQRFGWIATGGDIVRFDMRTGDRMGSFAAPGWQVADAVPDLCDGVIAIEEREGTTRLRRIRPEGETMDTGLRLDNTHVIAAARLHDRAAIHLVAQASDAWHIHRIDPGDWSVRTSIYATDPRRTPGRAVTMDGTGRLVFAAGDRAVFTAAEGLLEPRIDIDGPNSMDAIVDLLAFEGELLAATEAALYRVIETAEAAEALSARYLTPVLRSPLGDRQGWQRADIFADLPEGAQVTIRSRGFTRSLDAAHYQSLLNSDPTDPFIKDGWSEETASIHNGTGASGPLRHFLGDIQDEYLALNIHISLPACAPAIRIEGLDVLYPDRSLIENLPDIFATGGAGEVKTRRMLAPFQALADEIDDLIGDAIRRVDPTTADDLWAGFLLSWLGHGAFSGLPADLRRALLIALPEILPRRGTLDGLKRVMTALAPRGFRIEDSSQGPDIWVLPRADDPIGARLGCDTATTGHRPKPWNLGGCFRLGDAILGDSCFDPSAAQSCGADVTIHVYGGDAAHAEIGPFADRIIRAFVPANTRTQFVFGAIPPAETLDTEPGDTFLLTLDAGSNPQLGVWTLPTSGPGAEREARTVDDAVLDGSLILE